LLPRIIIAQEYQQAPRHAARWAAGLSGWGAATARTRRRRAQLGRSHPGGTLRRPTAAGRDGTRGSGRASLLRAPSAGAA